MYEQKLEKRIKHILSLILPRLKNNLVNVKLCITVMKLVESLIGWNSKFSTGLILI